MATTEALGIRARVLGGVAVALHDHAEPVASLRRPYADIDLVVAGGDESALAHALAALGYVGERSFNALHGHKRQLFLDEANDRQLDIFIRRFEMCHKLDLQNRLRSTTATLEIADLLLTKLQIVELNQKDVVDALAIVLGHEVGQEAAGDVIGLDRLINVTAGDWGWYTTIHDNLSKVAERAPSLLDGDRPATVRQRLSEIVAALERAPKSPRWRLRDLIGRRMAWYELPEERVR